MCQKDNNLTQRAKDTGKGNPLVLYMQWKNPTLVRGLQLAPLKAPKPYLPTFQYAHGGLMRKMALAVLKNFKGAFKCILMLFFGVLHTF